jgi:hypothetical protein
VDVRSVVFGFVVLLATTLNFGFVLGAIDDPVQHDAYELFSATAVSLVATLLKLGDRSHVGAVHLATSLVADLQLLTAVLIWTVAAVTDHGVTPATTTVVVSVAAGALLANLVSVTLLVTETIPTLNRR